LRRAGGGSRPEQAGISSRKLASAGGLGKGRINIYLAEKTFRIIFETGENYDEAYKTDQKTFRGCGRLGTFVCQQICQKPSGNGRL
jgi:hypothetical protein